MSVAFRSIEVGPFPANCFILWDESTRKAAIIDPGGDMDTIKDLVVRLGVTVDLILITHGHLDHCFHAGDLAEFYGARIAMHSLDIQCLEQNLPIVGIFYDMSKYKPFEPSILLSEGDVIPLGASVIWVSHTPGHSPGGVCFITDVGIFCGDTIFAGAIGRTDLPGGSYDDLMASIRSKILTLDDSTPIHPGHGQSTTVGAERRITC